MSVEKIVTMTQKHFSDPIPLPHLIYKVHFHENEIVSNNIWFGATSKDVLKNIIQARAKESNGEIQKKDESKVIVVIELPVGGQVSQYSIGHSDDTLEVVILKHSLMLDPKALLFSGIETGMLNAHTDGPHTARGGIRLNECSKALKEFKLKSQKKGKNDDENNKMTLKFQLPDFVNRESLQHYSYCFEKSEDNPLQYSITYFEFDVKDPKEEQEEEKFKTASSMFFSDRNNTSSGTDTNQPSHRGSNRHTEGDSSRLNNNSNSNDKNNPNSNKSHFSNHNNSDTSAAAKNSSSNTSDSDDEDEAMSKKNGGYYNKNDFNDFKRELLEEMKQRENEKSKIHDKEKRNYAANLKQNLKAIKDQKKKMKEYDDRRQEVLDKQKALLDQHRAELDRRSEELKRLHEKYDKNMALMKAHKSEERHEETKNSLAVVSAKTVSTPRAIHTHPPFQSLVDSEAHTTLSKRQ